MRTQPHPIVFSLQKTKNNNKKKIKHYRNSMIYNDGDGEGGYVITSLFNTVS